MRREGFAAPILVLTARGEEADVVRALRLGADDYVTKPFGLLELLARVDALLRRRGAPGRSDRELRFGDVVVDVAARSVQRGGETVPLTPKELDLLLALARRDGVVASRVELIREVWGYPSSVITRTIDTHVAALRRKLEPEPRSPRYILTVSRVGYRFAGD